MYELASVTRRGDIVGQSTRHRVERIIPAVPEISGRIFSGERHRLVAMDVVIVATASFAAGAGQILTLVSAAGTVAVFGISGLYRPKLRYSALDDVARILLGVAAVVLASAWLPQPAALAPRAFAAFPIAWPATVVTCVLLGRTGAYAWLRRRRRRSWGEPTLIIGSGDVAIRLAEALHEDRTYGLAPLGMVGPPILTSPSLRVPLLDRLAGLDAVVARYRPRHLIIAFAGQPDASLVATLRQCRRNGITVFVVPRLFELPLAGSGAELVHGIPMIRMRPEPMRLRRWAVKRVIDITGAALGLLALSPLLALCAFAVRCESGRGGVLFRQERIGRDGKPFTIMKFRSLTPASATESQLLWNINLDSRLGPVGRLLRNSSLDELPQLLNVLRGDMSLVGPRPERPFFVEQFQRTYSGYPDRHRVPAGITGWAQIHGLRGDTSIEERVRFDNYYIENWSLSLDIKIMIRTVGSILGISGR